MARRAHRQEDGKQMQEKECEKKVSRAGCYVRLSREEKGNSIENQKAVIWEYIRDRTDIQIVREFIDCNKSGTDFQREGFSELIEAIEKKEIDCVIVKDLSRFGRNLDEVSEYLERVFPLLGVRFISVLDGYDSFHFISMEEQFLLQIKNLFHDRYAKDISRKIHSTVELMQKGGEITGSVPYGYRKKGKREIEVTEAAEVVQRIYRLALLGICDRKIADLLSREGFFTPMEYKRNGLLKGKTGDLVKRWQASSVKRILENECYTGKWICHKSVSRWYKGERRMDIAREEWICMEHICPVIITEEVFENVQIIRRLRKKEDVGVLSSDIKDGRGRKGE